MDRIIEATGYTVKEVNLINVKAKHVDNTLVLESINPTIGYPTNTNLSNKKIEKSVYFITKTLIPHIDIIELTKDIQRKCKYHFQTAVGVVCIEDKDYSCVKIYGLENDDQVYDLQKLFLNRGSLFYPDNKKIENKGKIKMLKQILMTEISEEIFEDSIFSEKYYIISSEFTNIKHITLQEFTKISELLKEKLSKLDFDIALSSIDYNGVAKHALRIISKKEDRKLSVSELNQIKNEYIKLSINKLTQIKREYIKLYSNENLTH